MSSSILRYNPNACLCCGCYAYFSYEQRQIGSAVAFAFFDFLTEDYFFANRWFASQAVAGVGLTRNGLDYVGWQSGEAACTFANDGTLTGFSERKYWGAGVDLFGGTPDYFGPPGNAGWDCINHPGGLVTVDPPSSEDATCDEHEYPHFTRGEVTGITETDFTCTVPPCVNLNGQDMEVGPIAIGRLYNERFEADWREIGETNIGAWESGASVSLLNTITENIFETPNAGPSNYSDFLYHQERKRCVFPIPRSGTGVRVTFDIIWAPRGGIEEAYDTVVWHWDQVTPGGYDENDSDTWPESPWFELPVPATAGRYYTTEWVVDCVSSTTPTVPGDVSVAQVA